MKKKILMGIFICSLAFGAVAMGNMEEVTAQQVQTGTEETVAVTLGKTSKQKEYTFNEETGTLTFTGKGRLNQNSEALKLKPTKIVVGEGYTSIGNYCFSSCSSVKQVVLPDTVKIIGSYAFSSCNKLKKVNFPEGLTSIKQHAFQYTSLVSAQVPETVTQVGASAFYGCTKLKEASVPASVENCGTYVFGYCKNLERVIYKTTDIPDGTFSYCRSLESMELPKGLKHIGSSAFAHTGIKEMRIPGSVTDLESYAFGDCRNLTKLELSKSVDVIPANLCQGCHSLKTIIMHKGTTAIGDWAFNNCDVEKISIPSSVKKIGSSAFKNCSKLESVEIGKGVEYIREAAFTNCNLSEVVIPGNVKAIGYEAFKNCGAKKITIQNGLKSIGNWTFSSNKNLENVKIPQSVRVIEPNAFADCAQLKTFSVSEENKQYSASNGMLLSKNGSILYCCPGGRGGKVTLPDSVSELTEYSFSGCKKVKAFEVGKNNSSFSARDGILYDKSGTVLIRYPEGLKGAVRLPKDVREIGSFAFSNSRLSGIVFNHKIKKIGLGAFENCKNLTTIKIPGNVKSIGRAAFWNCTNLKTVRMLDGVEKINPLAFNGCRNLKKIILPTSITSISSTAFSECYQATIYCSKISVAMDFAKKKYMKYKLV